VASDRRRANATNELVNTGFLKVIAYICIPT